MIKGARVTVVSEGRVFRARVVSTVANGTVFVWKSLGTEGLAAVDDEGITWLHGTLSPLDSRIPPLRVADALSDRRAPTYSA